MVENTFNVRVESTRVVLDVQVTLEEILAAQGVRPAADGGYDPAALQEAAQRHRSYLASHLQADADGRNLPLQVTRVISPAHFSAPHTTFYHYEVSCDRAGSTASGIHLRHDMLREYSFAPGQPWRVSYMVRTQSHGSSRLAPLDVLRSDHPVTVPTGWQQSASAVSATSSVPTTDSSRPFTAWLLAGAGLILALGLFGVRHTRRRPVFATAVFLLGLAALPCQAQQKRIYLAPDDHTDFIWSDTEANYYNHFLNMLDYYQQKADDTAGNAPDYRSKFTIDGSLWLQIYAANRTPAQFNALMQKIKDGHITAPLAPLCVSYGVMPSEAVLRGMYYSGKLERRYDMRFRLAQSMENATMALGVGSLWAGSGAKYVWQGICGCDTQIPNLTQRDAEIYTWRGRDGSSLLTKWYSFRHNKEAGGYAETRNLSLSMNWINSGSFAARHPWPIIGLFGQGWDDVVTMNQDLVNAAPGLTNASQRVIVSNELDFFQDFEANHGAPALDEKTVSYGNEWDTYCTSMAEVSATVKRSVEKLRGAEAMATLVSLQQPTFMQGRDAARELAFQDMSLYFEHDFTAVGNNLVTERKAWQRRVAGEITSYVDTLHDDAKAALGGLVAKTGANPRFVVFNPLSWSRTDFADFPYTGSPSIHVVDVSTGTDVPFQIVTVNGGDHLRIWAADVPAVGYKVFEIQSGSGTLFNDGPAANAGTGVISNARYNLTVANRGAITSFQDVTRANREFAASVNGRNINDLGAGANGTMTVENAGPVSITLKTISTAVMNHTTRVTLYRGGGRVDIHNDITQNFGGDPTWGFGFATTSPDVWHEEVGAVIRAKLNTSGGHYSDWNARYDYLTLNHFADMSGPIAGAPSGVTLSNADCFMFQLGASNVSTLDTATASINPVVGSDNNGLTNQAGDTFFTQRFALQTHDAFDQAEAMKFSLEHQNPFITTAVTGNASSPYPATSYSYLTINDPKVLLWSVKPHDDGIDQGVAARVWNQSGSPSNLSITAATGAFANAKKVSLIETDDAALTVTGGAVTDTLPAQKMQTYVFDTGVTVVPVSAPTVSPNGGTFPGGATVSLSTTEPGASIRYTLDGTTPSATHGTLYTGSFAVARSTTVKAIALSASDASVVTSAGFIITTPVSVVGNTTDGTQWDNVTDGTGQYINASRWQASSSFSAVSIKAYVSAITGHYRCAIYADSGGGTPQPAALLGAASEITNPSDGWQTFTLPSAVSITSGSHYWLCIWSDTQNAFVRTLTDGGVVRFPSPPLYTYSATWPQPLLTNQQNTYKHCIYAESGPPLSAFDQWKLGHSMPASAAPFDDGDGDFIPLLVEYALDLNPASASANGLPTLSFSNGLFSFTYLRAKGDVNYTVETSTDLTSWSPSGINQGTGAVGGPVTATLSQSGENRRFFRLRVEES